MASSALDRLLGTKLLIAAALVIVAAGLFQLATTSSAEGFGHALVGMLLLGAGAGITIAPGTACDRGPAPGPGRGRFGDQQHRCCSSVGPSGSGSWARSWPPATRAG